LIPESNKTLKKFILNNNKYI